MTEIFRAVVRISDVLCRVYMRVCALISPNTVSPTVFGARMNCNSRDFVQRRIRHFGIFEHNLTSFTRRELRPGDVYLDIGANVGYFTLLASRQVGPKGRVISVEADPWTFRRLVDNVELNDCPNVRALNVAATGEPCKVRIERKDAGNSGTNSIAADQAEGNIEGWTFETIAGDDLSNISFIKIDIEGSEAPILKAILDLSGRLSNQLIVASEVSEASAAFVAKFIAAGFDAYLMTNIYTIDYYLMRDYSKKFSEFETVHLERIEGYVPHHNDYVFVRGGRAFAR